MSMFLEEKVKELNKIIAELEEQGHYLWYVDGHECDAMEIFDFKLKDGKIWANELF